MHFILISIVLVSSIACGKITPEEERPLNPAGSTSTTEDPDAGTDDFGCGSGCGDCRLWLFGGESLGSTAKKTVLSFDGTTWTNEAEIPLARAYAGVTVNSGKVWLFGGSSSNTIFTSEDMVNWSSPGTLPANISPFYNVNFFAEKFWITGGGVGESAVNTIFNSSNGISWGLGGTLPVNVARHAAEVFNGFLRLFGGYNGSTLSSVIVSSSLGSTWDQQLSVLPGNLSEMAKARWKGKMWLAGGNSGTAIQTAVISSSDGSNWSTVGNLPEARYRGSMIPYKDKLWFIGGLDSDSVQTDTIWSSTDGATWVNEGTLSQPLSGAAIALYSKTCATGMP